MLQVDYRAIARLVVHVPGLSPAEKRPEDVNDSDHHYNHCYHEKCIENYASIGHEQEHHVHNSSQLAQLPLPC